MKVSRDEFVRLAMEQIDAVDRVARGLAHGSTHADDLVQETYLRALRAYGSFELGEYGIRPWLLRILHNIYATRLKRESRQPVVMEFEQLASAEWIPAALPFDATSIADERLDEALKQLPPALCATLLLWAVEELSYKEIAHVLEIPIGTVMSRLYRARHELGKLLSDHPMARPPRE